MRIFDCFCFWNELELLELRLAELAGTVDVFVIAEADRTHTGRPKEFILAENWDRYPEYRDRIVYVQVTDAPSEAPADEIERFQRDALMRGLRGRAHIGDIVLLSDLDEMPRPAAVRANLGRAWLYLREDLYYYYVNCLCSRSCGGTVLADYGTFRAMSQLRMFGRRRYRFDPARHPEVIGDGGWHYSYMGGVARIEEKVDSTWDARFIAERIGDVGERVRKLEDLYGRGWYQLAIVDISQTQPAAMPAFLARHPSFYYRGELSS